MLGDEIPPYLHVVLTDDTKGHRYEFFPYGEITRAETRLVMAWCRRQFGRRAPMHEVGSRWTSQDAVVWLRDTDDAFAFRMRWG